MPYIDVDIDLDEFETSDLLGELTKRIEQNRPGRKGVSEKQVEAFKKSIQEAMAGADLRGRLPIDNMDDKLKMEHLERVWRKYN